MTKLVRAVFALIGALPFISWTVSTLEAGAAATALLERWFRFQCHGRLDRTVALAGQYFPVCSRCLGIYSGLLLAAVLARPRLTPLARRVWLVLATALMIGQVWLQDRAGGAPNHPLRFVTGLLLAWPVVLIVLAACEHPATTTGRAASDAER